MSTLKFEVWEMKQRGYTSRTLIVCDETGCGNRLSGLKTTTGNWSLLQSFVVDDDRSISAVIDYCKKALQDKHWIEEGNCGESEAQRLCRDPGSSCGHDPCPECGNEVECTRTPGRERCAECGWTG